MAAPIPNSSSKSFSYSPSCITLFQQLQQEEIQFKELHDLNYYDGDMRGPGTQEELNLLSLKISKLRERMKKEACPEAMMRAYQHMIQDKKMNNMS